MEVVSSNIKHSLRVSVFNSQKICNMLELRKKRKLNSHSLFYVCVCVCARALRMELLLRLISFDVIVLISLLNGNCRTIAHDLLKCETPVVVVAAFFHFFVLFSYIPFHSNSFAQTRQRSPFWRRSVCNELHFLEFSNVIVHSDMLLKCMKLCAILTLVFRHRFQLGGWCLFHFQRYVHSKLMIANCHCFVLPAVVRKFDAIFRLC